MFEEQPVWSRSALAAHLSSSPAVHVLSAALPALAYYFVSGPWRGTWVRLGYDPRSDPQAKIYQTLDIRIPRNMNLFLLFCFFWYYLYHVLTTL